MSIEPKPCVETVLTCKGYAIRKSSLDVQQIRKTKSDLIAKPIHHPDFPAAKPFPIYQETDKWLRVPRAYGIQTFGHPGKYCLQPNDVDAEHVHFKNDLFPQQVDAFNETMTTFRQPYKSGLTSGMLSLPTGFGKTVVALKIASTLQKRTCILVHKDLLLHQWIDAIKKFMPKATIGVIQGPKKSFESLCDFYVVMIQTLMNIESVPNIFGFTIWDETHHAPSTTFSTIFYKIGARYMLGLSATLKRKDGLFSILEHQFGKIIYSKVPDRSEQLCTDVQVWEYDNPDFTINLKEWTNAVTKLCSDQKRSQYILNILKKIVIEDVQKQRHILVLTERVFHTTFLFSEMKVFLQKMKIDRSCTVIGGKLKDKKEREARMKMNIIFATYSLMGEGVDIPHLNTLVFASPKKDVVQALGRIFRQVHSIQPMVIDVSDSVAPGQARQRLATYKKELKGNIQVTYFCEDDVDEDNISSPVT